MISSIMISPILGGAVLATRDKYNTVYLPNGSTVELNTSKVKTGDGYKYNNLFRAATAAMVAANANYFFLTGEHLPESRLKELFPDEPIGDIDVIRKDTETLAKKENIDLDQLKADTSDTRQKIKENYNYLLHNSDGTWSVNSDLINSESDSNGAASEDNIQENAYTDFSTNPYYSDIWNYKDPNTTGYDIYNNLIAAERASAQENLNLANAQYQNAALQQASIVKNITDQVRAERMARLRAGMSESQIANQDMQMMMSNINALNDQMNALNYSGLQAQQQLDNAQHTAYKEYLTNAQALNQSAAANYAAQTGDAAYYAKWLRENPGMSLTYDKVTGQYKTSNN